MIICGYGQMAKMFFRQKKEKIANYIILDKNPKRVEQARKDGYQAIVDDASRFETLSKLIQNREPTLWEKISQAVEDFVVKIMNNLPSLKEFITYVGKQLMIFLRL